MKKQGCGQRWSGRTILCSKPWSRNRYPAKNRRKKWGKSFISLGKIETSEGTYRVQKTRHFINWLRWKFFSFSLPFFFFFGAWHTFGEKHPRDKCSCIKRTLAEWNRYPVTARSTNNDHLYSAILLRNNAITPVSPFFFSHENFILVTQEINRLKRIRFTSQPVSSARLFIRFSAPEWETFSKPKQTPSFVS